MAKPLRRAVSAVGPPSAGVLMYHRIAEEAEDPWDLCVSPDHFAEQMEVIARRDARIDLDELAGKGGFDRAGNRLAVTFDDGYIDNITRALPVLEQFEIPATFFVVSGALGRNREFWWDGLERALLGSAPLPTTLSIDLAGRVLEFELADDDARLPARQGASISRQKLFLLLWEEIVRLPPDRQDDVVDRLLAWAGKPVAAASTRVAAGAQDIARLASHPLIRIGSHTAHHISLPDFAADTQRSEIEAGHRMLEELVGHRINRFCYPYGRYDDSARDIVRGLKVDFACTSRESVVTARSDHLALPRLQVKNINGESFVAWLRGNYHLIAGRAPVH